VERWRPERGQVVLIELLDHPDAPALTGAVEGDGPGPVLIHLGASPPLPEARCQVTASFFTPEALYLARGEARALGGGLIELEAGEVQAVQRRAAPRLTRRYPVALGAFAGVDDYVSVSGETVDLAPGGCRVLVDSPLPDGSTPTVCIQVADEPVMAHARVVEDHAEGGRWAYRLAFEKLDEPDRRRLAAVLAS
jgi:hypothetical protein